MAKLNPYLNFENTREAMNFYKECLGGELILQTVSEMPEMAAQMPTEMKDKILHSMLTSGDIVLMASDLNMEKRSEGNTIHLCLNCTSDEEINSLFAKLSPGGKITEPLNDMPWGGKYGSLIDKFNIYWVFNFQKKTF